MLDAIKMAMRASFGLDGEKQQRDWYKCSFSHAEDSWVWIPRPRRRAAGEHVRNLFENG
jgi:hypothetical protein